MAGKNKKNKNKNADNKAAEVSAEQNEEKVEESIPVQQTLKVEEVKHQQQQTNTTLTVSQTNTIPEESITITLPQLKETLLAEIEDEEIKLEGSLAFQQLKAETNQEESQNKDQPTIKEEKIEEVEQIIQKVEETKEQVTIVEPVKQEQQNIQVSKQVHEIEIIHKTDETIQIREVEVKHQTYQTEIRQNISTQQKNQKQSVEVKQEMSIDQVQDKVQEVIAELRENIQEIPASLNTEEIVEEIKKQSQIIAESKFVQQILDEDKVQEVKKQVQQVKHQFQELKATIEELKEQVKFTQQLKLLQTVLEIQSKPQENIAVEPAVESPPEKSVEIIIAQPGKPVAIGCQLYGPPKNIQQQVQLISNQTLQVTEPQKLKQQPKTQECVVVSNEIQQKQSKTIELEQSRTEVLQVKEQPMKEISSSHMQLVQSIEITQQISENFTESILVQAIPPQNIALKQQPKQIKQSFSVIEKLPTGEVITTSSILSAETIQELHRKNEEEDKKKLKLKQQEQHEQFTRKYAEKVKRDQQERQRREAELKALREEEQKKKLLKEKEILQKTELQLAQKLRTVKKIKKDIDGQRSLPAKVGIALAGSVVIGGGLWFGVKNTKLTALGALASLAVGYLVQN